MKLTRALFRYVVNTADHLDLSVSSMFEILHLGVLQLRCWRLSWVIVLFFLHFKMHRAPACVGLSTGLFEHKVKFEIQAFCRLAATAGLHNDDTNDGKIAHVPHFSSHLNRCSFHCCSTLPFAAVQTFHNNILLLNMSPHEQSQSLSHREERIPSM